MNAEETVSKPKVFLFINSGAGTDMVMSMAMAEDGTVVGGHCSSSNGFAKHDIGATSTWHHDGYAKHYPDGYECEWVDDVKGHAGLMAASALNQERGKAAEAQS